MGDGGWGWEGFEGWGSVEGESKSNFFFKRGKSTEVSIMR